MVTSYATLSIYELWDKLQFSLAEAHTAVKVHSAVQDACSSSGMDADASTCNTSTCSNCCAGSETLHWF